MTRARGNRLILGVVLIVVGSFIAGKGFGMTGWMR